MAKKFIKEFVLTNIKHHKKLAATINGKHFIAAGPNGAGKTTVFQAIRRHLASLPESQKPSEWINKDEDSGAIRLVVVNDGTEYFTDEKFSRAGSRSRIRLWRKVADGKEELTPAQAQLKAIFGQVLDFTPLMDMSGEEQFEFLQKQMSIDVSGYKLKRQQKYETRTQKGGLLKIAEAGLNDPNLYVTEVDRLRCTETKDIADILKKRKDSTAATVTLQDAEKKVAKLPLIESDIKSIETQIAALQKQLEEKHKEKQCVKEIDITALKKSVTDIEDANKKVDAEITTLTEHNTMVEKVKLYNEKQVDVAKYRKEKEDLTKEIEELDNKLNNALAALPFESIYPGLKLVYQLSDDGKSDKIGLFLDSLPFHRNQLSYGHMVKAIIKLSVYLNPDGLNFVYVGQWNELDKQNQDDLIKFAEENENVQLGIEKVDDKSEISIEFLNLE